MIPFKAPIDDILFSLTHVAGAAELSDWDPDFVADIAGHFAGFAEAELAPLNAPGDAQGCRLVGGRVVMPDGFKAAYQAFVDQGWPGLTVPENHGGQGLDDTVLAAVSEIFSGANHSLQMVTGLVPGAVRTLLRFGSDEQCARLIPQLANGSSLATMCLTEPGAGSDLSAVRCRALPQGGGWQIQGEKIFISGGGQDLSDNILHLVLARTSDDGLKGLSLFLCDGRAAGDAIQVTRIEEKMGLHASPTCALSFNQAPAELLGKLGQGLAAMFTMMNHARLDVGLQGVAHAARAHNIAAAYAAERVQGRNMDGTPATLDAHADVRGMLDDMDALALGSRAIAHLAAVTLVRGDNPELAEFLTPIAKVAGSNAGIKASELGIQILGGYGYLREYCLEQTYRDARITAIYEGANGIHAKALATRLLRGEPARAFAKLVESAAIFECWQDAARRLEDSHDPAPHAQDFMVLSELALLQTLWPRVLAASSHHPQPARLQRVANRAMARGAALARAHAAMIE